MSISNICFHGDKKILCGDLLVSGAMLKWFLMSLWEGEEMSPKKQKMLQVGSSEDDDDDDDIPSHDEQPDEEINNEERNDDDMEEQEESTDVQPGEDQMCKHSQMCKM